MVWMELYLAVVEYCEKDRSAHCDAFAVERRNHLGSVTRIYDTSGTAVFSAEYDPWGVQRQLSNTIRYNRGYCGHEMLNDLQLINMNGRMYDPYLGRLPMIFSHFLAKKIIKGYGKIIGFIHFYLAYFIYRMFTEECNGHRKHQGNLGI